jgi:DnaK suppressor protein
MADLTELQRAELLERVARERARATRRVAALERDFSEIVRASADAVRDDEHDPEGATIAFERAQVAALIAQARAQEAALDEAARRLRDADAGRCESCGGAIGYERLVARPAATTCVGCAARR